MKHAVYKYNANSHHGKENDLFTHRRSKATSNIKYMGLDSGIILKRILYVCGESMCVWTGFVWHMIGSNDRLLCIAYKASD
jgi:hypothetical protein